MQARNHGPKKLIRKLYEYCLVNTVCKPSAPMIKNSETSG
jgi:hypothetical protein